MSRRITTAAHMEGGEVRIHYARRFAEECAGFKGTFRISALKKSGHNIRREMVSVGGGKKVASYWIEGRQAA